MRKNGVGPMAPPASAFPPPGSRGSISGFMPRPSSGPAGCQNIFPRARRRVSGLPRIQISKAGAGAGKISAPAARIGLPAHRETQILVNLGKKILGIQPCLVAADENGEILGHETLLDGLDADFLQKFGESCHLGRCVELAATARPRSR